MIYKNIFVFAGCIFVLFGCVSGKGSSPSDPLQLPPPIPPDATVRDTGYLKIAPGYKGDVLGAEIETISPLDDEQLQLIEISIPGDPEQIDQVQVISPAGEVLMQDRSAEILRDSENNNTGIKIFLPKSKNLGFKLRLIDLPDDN